MKEIQLTQGKVALIDDNDFERVSKHKWHTFSKGYAATRMGEKKIYLHRFIMDAADDVEIDHIDGNPLNNQRANLRACTHKENTRNRKPNKRDIGLKGIEKTPNGRWRAAIVVDGKKHYIGTYDEAIRAAIAYDEQAIKLHGRFARTNFLGK